MTMQYSAYKRASVSPGNPSAPLSADAATASTHPYTIAMRNTNVLHERLAATSFQNRGNSTASMTINRTFERKILMST